MLASWLSELWAFLEQFFLSVFLVAFCFLGFDDDD